MTTFQKKIRSLFGVPVSGENAWAMRLGVMLEAVSGFAVLGACLEWLHPGLVSDVIPWAAVAGAAGALAIGLAWRTRRELASARWWTLVMTAVVALATAYLAFDYFASIPRLQPWLAAAAGVTVALGSCLFIYRQPQP